MGKDQKGGGGRAGWVFCVGRCIGKRVASNATGTSKDKERKKERGAKQEASAKVKGNQNGFFLQGKQLKKIAKKSGGKEGIGGGKL